MALYAAVTGAVGVAGIVWFRHELMVSQTRRFNQAWDDYNAYYKQLRKEGYNPLDDNKLEAGWEVTEKKEFIPAGDEFSLLQKSMKPILFPEPWRRTACRLLRVKEPESFTVLRSMFFDDCCFQFAPKGMLGYQLMPNPNDGLAAAFQSLDENNDPILRDMVACLESIPETFRHKQAAVFLLEKRPYVQSRSGMRLKELLRAML